MHSTSRQTQGLLYSIHSPNSPGALGQKSILVLPSVNLPLISSTIGQIRWSPRKRIFSCAGYCVFQDGLNALMSSFSVRAENSCTNSSDAFSRSCRLERSASIFRRPGVAFSKVFLSFYETIRQKAVQSVVSFIIEPKAGTCL